jgi:transcriptional regulator with XRE-family HTH domain
MARRKAVYPKAHSVIRQLRAARIQRKLPLKVVAFNAGVEVGHAGRIERGVIAPNLVTLRKLANALGYELTLIELKDGAKKTE